MPRDEFDRELKWCLQCGANTPRLPSTGFCIPCDKPTYEQFWACRQCEKHGTVDYEEDEPKTSVIRKITDDHAEVSPECAKEFRTNAIHYRTAKAGDSDDD